MTTIVFSHSISGHFLEYLNHIYKMCGERHDKKFIFVVPTLFDSIKDKLNWSEAADNISFDYLDDKEISLINTPNPIFSSYHTAKIIGKRVKKHKAEKVFSTLLIGSVPFLPFFVSGRVKVSGIIYMIYLYRLNNSTLSFRMLNKAKYLVLKYCSIYYKVLILNDVNSANQLNHIYKTDKFIPLPDPYVPLVNVDEGNIRKRYSIKADEKLFIHIGAMNVNKGTLDILKSLELLNEDERKKYVYIFAGKVEDDIKERFYNWIRDNQNNYRIIIKDEFCDYSYFAQLCQECDALLLPYRRTSQSSGIIGYASQFGKPVIAPSSGLLGNLVETYGLGLGIKDTSPASLNDAYDVIANVERFHVTDNYSNTHTVKHFQDIIINFL